MMRATGRRDRPRSVSCRTLDRSVRLQRARARRGHHAVTALVAALVTALTWPGAAQGQQAIEQGVPFECASCTADVGRASGQDADFTLPERAARATAEGGAFGAEDTSLGVVGLSFELASCTPFPVDITMNGVFYSGVLRGFGGINEGSFRVSVVLRDVTNDVVVDEITLHQQSEDGAFGEGGVTSINSFTDMLPSSATFTDAAVVPGRQYEVTLNLFARGQGLLGGADMVASFQSVVIDNSGPDQDGDGLFDLWETEGINYDCQGPPEVDLPALGATVDRKDLFVEVDYMELHEPDPVAMNDVIVAFDIAPVDNPVGASTGIALHIEIDDEIPHVNNITTWSGFDTRKQQWFGTEEQRSAPNADSILAAKRLAYRYALFVHTRDNGGSSGKAEGANDFVVSLGADTWERDPVTLHHVGSRRQQAGTFMHELGHTLGLGHGGTDGVNCKPNYLSVMSYAHQTRWIQSPGFPLGRLDYSAVALDPIDEAALVEANGIGAGTLDLTRYSPDNGVTILSGVSNGPIDWDNSPPFPDPGPVAVDINNFAIGGCGLDEDRNPAPSPGQVLNGADDWSNLRYNFRGHPSFADGVHTDPDLSELTAEDAVRIENQPPVADAGQDEEVECSSHDGGTFALDGSGSSDPDSTPGTNDDIVLFEWFVDFGGPGEELVATGAMGMVDLQPGVHVVTLRVTDRAGATATDTVVKTVADTIPPDIHVSLDPTVLWPPNHRLVPISASVQVTDICDPNPVVILAAITSSEPDDTTGTGDGSTQGDIQSAEPGSADFSFSLRAERAGSGPGRVYTAAYDAIDASGNQASDAAIVTVPKNNP